MKLSAGGEAVRLPEATIAALKGLDPAVLEKMLPSFATNVGIPEDELRALLLGGEPEAPEQARARKASHDPRLVVGRVFTARPKLGEHEREMIERAAGTHDAGAPRWPHRDPHGNYVYPTITPTEHRTIQAARKAFDQEKIVAQMRDEAKSK